MKILNTVAEVQDFITTCRKENKTVGYVPTMGALHSGHISLVKQALNTCDICIVTVFVNPTQFNDPKDLETYPRDFESDAKKLEEAGAHAVFYPSVKEVYPTEDKRYFNVGAVAEVMEGSYRPGHFNGVMQVVSRFFDIIKPDKAFFGEKDFQQIAVVRAMVKQLALPVEILACPIIREPDGLALSSRNVRLTPENRAQAPKIHRILSLSTQWMESYSPARVKEKVIDEINSIPGMRVEYYEIVNGTSLLPIESWDDSSYIIGCITVYCGDVRLIDNIHYNKS